MRTIRTSVFYSALISLSSSIAVGQAPASYVYCYGQSAGGPQHFSTPFEVVVSGSFADGQLGFLKYLEQKYAFKGLVQCTSPRTLEVARAELKKVADDIQRGMNLKIETDWVYTKAAATPPAPAVPAPQSVAPASPPAATPAKSALPPPAPVPPAPPPAPVVQPTHAVCWADADPQTRYYSAVFDGTKGDYADWMPAFKDHLVKKYKYTRHVRCTKQPTKVAAEKYWNEMVGTARGITLAGGVKVKVIETGWVY